MLWGVQGFFFNPPSKDKQALAEFFFACNFVIAYIRNTPCFHCKKMALPDTDDPRFFRNGIAAAREEDEADVW